MVEQRQVAVPDLGDDFVMVVDDLAQALVALVDEEADPAEERLGVLAPVLIDGFGIEAFDRIWAVLKPTQEFTSPA